MNSLNGGFGEGVTLTDPRSPGSPRRPPTGDGPRLSRRGSCGAAVPFRAADTTLKQGKPRRKGKAAAPPAAPAAPSVKKGPPPLSAPQAAAQFICAAVRNLRRQKLSKTEYRATLRVLASEA
eukprot:gene10144-3598_t